MSQIDHKRYLYEMRKRIRKIYAIKGTRKSTQRSPGEELREIVKRHRRALRVLPPDIELWLALFDEAMALWFAIWGAYREWVEGPENKQAISLMTLAGRAMQDAVCIRELIVGGFFVQSNVVARSFIEAIDLMHLLNSRPDLATDFFVSVDNKSTNEFWHRNCSKGKIDKLVKVRWLWFGQGDEQFAESFFSMREHYIDLVGMSVHPSFPSSFSTFMDSSLENANIFNTAMGSISQMSKFTIHLILLRIFEYGILWSGPKISLYKGEGNEREKPLLYDNIVKGLTMIFSTIVMLGERSPNDPFFPDFKTYWPRDSFES